MSEQKVLCPKCRSSKTRDSEVKNMLETGGKIAGKAISLGAIPLTGIFGDTVQRGFSKICGEIGGGVASMLWHKRVCDRCGHCWWY